MKKIVILITLLFPTFLFSQNYKFGKVSLEELQEKVYPLDSTAPAAILYSERETRFDYTGDRGFFLVDEYFVRLKIYNQEGFDYATKTIPLYYDTATNQEEVTTLKGVTYTLEGNEIVKTKLEKDRIFNEKTNKYWNQTKFTMPNIKDGCIVEWQYTVESPFIGKLDEYVFQTYIPINKVVAKISIPEYFVYNTKTKGYQIIPMEKEKKDRTITYSYETFNTRGYTKPVEKVNSSATFTENIFNIEINKMSALQKEPYAGNIHNFASGLVFELAMTKYPNAPFKTYATDWEAVTKNIYESESFGEQLKDKNYFEDDLQLALSGKASESDRLNAVFNFVRSKIKYDGYKGLGTDGGVKKAYKNGVGNLTEVNLNLVNMLRYAGFDANPVLVSTVDNGIPLFPSRSSFNYVIVSVNTTQGKVLLDASNAYTPINVLPEETLNFQGREIHKDGTSEWINLFPAQHSVSKITISAKITDNGIEGNSRKMLNNNNALNYREKVSKLSKEEMTKHLNEYYETIDVLDSRIVNLEDFNKDIGQTIKFETESYIEDISGKTYISPLLFEAEENNPFKIEKREYPIYFNKPWVHSVTVNLQIPEGYSIESVPEDKEILLPDNLGGFQYKIVQKGSLIQIDSNIVINQPVIQSAEYDTIKNFFKDIIVKHAEKIILVRN